MASIATVLTGIASRMGVDTTNPDFVKFLETATLEVPDTVSAAFEAAKVYTPESAKNDSELKRLFFSQALNAVDKNLSDLVNEFQMPEEFRTSFSAIQSTYDRVPALVRGIKALEAQKQGATAGEKANLQQQINALQAEKAAEIKRIQDAANAEISNLRNENQTIHIRGRIASKKLDTSKFDAPIMENLAFNMLQSELNAKGVKIVKQNDNFVLKQAADESLDYYENNQAVTLDNFIDRVLANNKLIAVNEPGPAPVNNNGQQWQQPSGPSRQQSHNTPPNGQQPAGSSFLAKLEAAKADYEANGRVM